MSKKGIVESFRPIYGLPSRSRLTRVDIGSNGRGRRDGSFVSGLKSVLEVIQSTVSCGKG